MRRIMFARKNENWSQLALIIFLLLQSKVLVAESLPVIQLSDSASEISLYQYYQVLQSDSTLEHKAALNQFLSGAGKTYQNPPTFGFSDQTIWYIFKMKSRAAVLTANPARLENIQVWVLPANLEASKLVIDRQNVSDLSFKEIGFNRFDNLEATNVPLFPVIELEPYTDGEQIVLIRMQSSISILEGDLKLYTHRRWYEYKSRMDLFYGVVFGAMIIIALYNMVLSILVKRIGFMFYALYVLSLVLSHASISGHLYYLPFLTDLLKTHGLYFFGLISMAMGFRFAQSYLELEKSRFLFKLTNAFMLLIGIVFIAVLLFRYGLPAYEASFFKFLMVFINLGTLTIIFVSWKRFRQGYKKAVYFLVSWPWVIAGVAIKTLVVLAILPATFWTVNSMYIGSVIEVLLLSIGIGAYFGDIEIRGRLDRKASQNKSEFLSRMSHELRTPLNAINGMVELIQDEGKANPGYTRTLGNASENLLAIVNDVLDVSKIEAGRLKLESITFNLESLLESCVGLFPSQARAKGLDFHYDAQLEGAVNYVGDPTRLRQVIVKLLSNAMKFTERGHVSLSVAINSSEVDAQFADLLIEVNDTGIGISEEDQKKIMEPFNQAFGGIARSYGGTGLGLCIVHELVELMQGKINIESEIGLGAKFTVQIPMQKEKPANRATDTSNAMGVDIIERKKSALKGKRVLVAEDNQDNIMLLKAFIKDLDLEIDLAHNGAEAIELARQNEFDLILMDMQMPEVDGLQATRHIRSNEKLESQKKPVPIYAISAHVTKIEIENCLEAGCDGHLGKPYRKQEIMELLMRVL